MVLKELIFNKVLLWKGVVVLIVIIFNSLGMVILKEVIFKQFHIWGEWSF